ncbi:MAG TPA: NUDIX hydrolase [Herpetosiphonaceae bacterium]|nr:NUDIX hydrolase [Herpetosiphonaceae bacterium]
MVIEDNRVLMVQQTYQGARFWTFPSGGIEPGETPEMAARREAKEEVGLDVAIIGLLYCAPRRTSTGTYYCYLGRRIPGSGTYRLEPSISDAEEIHAACWFSLEQVMEHPEVAQVLVQFEEPCQQQWQKGAL